MNVSSLAGLVGVPALGTYTASKHGLIGLTKTAALEYAERGIRVNAVCPAAIATSLLLGLPPVRQQELVSPQAIKRLGHPEEPGNVGLLHLVQHRLPREGSRFGLERQAVRQRGACALLRVRSGQQPIPPGPRTVRPDSDIARVRAIEKSSGL